jgi:hypothetical protein
MTLTFPTNIRIAVAQIFLFSSALFAQEMAGYQLEASNDFELVGIPIQRPELATIKIKSAQKDLATTWNSISTSQTFSIPMLKNRECYAEVIGPSTHSALGHRLEIDELASLKRKDGKLIFKVSPKNSTTPEKVLVLGTELAIREHFDVSSLLGDIVKKQILYGKQKPESFQFFLNQWVGKDILKLTSFQNPNGSLYWKDPSSRVLQREDTTIPLGSALGIKFGLLRGPVLGLTGDRRSTPLPFPLRAGWNLLSYPYPKDLRLGTDWGETDSGILGGTAPTATDLLQICQGPVKVSYAFEVPKSGLARRWRQVNSERPTEWKFPATYLDVVPAGQGFLLWKAKADSNHCFHPPKS